MTHSEIQELLLDYTEGTLTGGPLQELQEHLKSCSECRELLFLLRFLEKSAADPDSDIIPRHPNSREIAEFAFEGTGLNPEERAMVAAHVQECEPCQEFVAFARQARSLPDGPAARTTSARSRWLPRGLTGYAAAAMILFMLYPAYMGLTGTGRGPSPQIAGGSASLFLDANQGDDLPSLVLDPDKDFLQLMVYSPVFASATANGDRVRVLVEAEDGSDTILDREGLYGDLMSGELRAFVIMMLPARGRHLGAYRIRLTNLDKEEVTYNAQFNLIGPPD